ncbi:MULTISPECIES: MFS transporter [unclassified Bradyrhizobium]|uniref:MFS transporter n=1 Tax=unclassified Bradyrhizobium TaxID=2631580 RepID=UPI001BAA5B2F|nr:MULTISPECIES: MFS transporter [unclassified Bradyrhizobium]MBR1205767.1 MFS transporter [Bradyrhizobium sp. AUGA SZCCT0124]MBR1315844.1 MFS transporter [Bradyrhizobium sp. AUGA SZCCT0051]MBR1338094.1 MFS transporter [Bradyrhizobium sp. AUGA SZCCT0105]MBR1355749.1 MFS transporter [Bradyrhizobium sp. AUGA SZCCT0045]
MSGTTRTSALAPFRIRSYRFQWPSDLLTSWAFEVETLVLGWYIMVETGSVLLLTVMASLQYVGTLVAPVVGMIGDRMGHRDLLAVMRFAYTALAGTIMILALTGHLAPLNVMIIVALMGVIRPSDLGVRGALLADIMPPAQLVGAISLARTTQDSARIAGALSGAGLFAALGIGYVYVGIASFYFVAAILMLCMGRPAQVHGAADQSANDLPGSALLRDLKEGIVYAWSGPGMRAALCVAFLANLTAFPLTNGLLPYVARDIFHTDQTGLGYLSASFAFGSLIGSITLSMAGGVRIARLLIGATLAWYAMLLVFVELRTMPVAMACLVLAGIAQSMSMISAAVMLMRNASAHLRGRVMGVRMMVIYGLPLGLLAAGSLIDLIGYTATGTLLAAAGFIAMLAIALHWRADLWPVHAPANAR